MSDVRYRLCCVDCAKKEVRQAEVICAAVNHVALNTLQPSSYLFSAQC